MRNETDVNPDLGSAYPVAELQVARFQSDGHIRLDNVAASSKIGVYRAAIQEAADRVNTETRALADRGDTYSKAFLQMMNLWREHEVVKRFSLARRFAGIAASLMGVDGVRIYHDQALFKEAGGGHTPWHQDHYYWPLDTDNTITMWMALEDLDDDMGTLTFASGSHAEGYLGTLPISDESDEVFNSYVKKKGFDLFHTGGMKAGDATFHNGWTLHSAPGNRSGRMREAMTVIYYADGARAIEPVNDNQSRDLANWLPGTNPGELAASPLNPLLCP